MASSYFNNLLDSPFIPHTDSQHFSTLKDASLLEILHVSPKDMLQIN